MRDYLLTTLACLAIASCTEQSASPVHERQGTAELRVDAASLAAAGITRVVVQRGEETQELVFNNATRSYDGTMFLASGPQTLVGRAFSGDVLVGASNPVTVDITPGHVNRVILRILDLRTAGAPPFGPLFDSLTFPTTVNAGTNATFAISVIAPTHDPVTYQWSSNCADSTFTAPDAAQTGWSKPSQGSCRIDVVATSNGLSITQSFLVVVFSGADAGGATLIGSEFVSPPDFLLALSADTGGCILPPGQGLGFNATCDVIVSAPDTIDVQVPVDSWGNSTPGDLTLSDDCGGRFGIDLQDSDSLRGTWMPPPAGGLCFLTMRATNGDGVSSSVRFAFLTRPGTLRVTQPPILSMALGNCFIGSWQDTPQDCGVFAANSQLDFAAGTSWQDSQSGMVTVTDDCGGGQFHGTGRQFGRLWTASGAPGSSCHLTVTATNLEGISTTRSALYRLF